MQEKNKKLRLVERGSGNGGNACNVTGKFYQNGLNKL